MTQTNAMDMACRLLIAVLFILSGIGKIAAPAMTQGYIASAGLPEPMLSMIIAIAVELGGGILILIGCQTRMVSLGLAAFVFATAVVFNNNFGDQNQMIQFMKNVAIIGGLFQVAAFGPGRYSIDVRRRSVARSEVDDGDLCR